MENHQLQASVQHEDESLYVNRGLRDYFSYRDLGIAAASDGRIIAQINRANQAVTKEGELHHHVLDTQWNLIVRGWAKMKFEGTGIVHLAEGTCFHMPANIKHTFVACSNDLMILEVCTPADFSSAEDDPDAYDETAQLPQNFFMQTEEDGIFKTQGLRDYFTYRDLGIAKATDGTILAQIIRAERSVEEPGDVHYHVLNDQFVYVLNGWAKVRFEGSSEHIVKAGACFYQPSQIRHAFLACSEDFKALEVCLPADFETISV